MKVNVAAQGRLRGSLTSQITPREREIIQLVCSGLTNKEIAARLSIIVGTVNAHLGRIYERTGVRDRVELAAQGEHLLTTADTSM